MDNAFIGTTLASIAAAFLTGCGVTRAVVWAAQRWRILDLPNERSAHTCPTPTLGGLGVISGFWAGVGVLLGSGQGKVLAEGSIWIMLGCTVVLLVLVFDDSGRPLKVGGKLTLQFLSIGCWLYWGPRFEWITLPLVGKVALGGWSWLVTALWFIWLENVFNFMDGIDGMTAIQTMAVGCVLAACFWQLGNPLWQIAAILAAAAAGFLVFNFPPARIFMGDIGSVSIGFIIAALGVLGEGSGLPLWIFVAILGYYIFDSTYTIARRALRGENVLQAHRQHLYQQLDQRHWGHWRIDLWALLLTLLLAGGGYICLSGWFTIGAGVIVAGGSILIGTSLWLWHEEKGN